jgi:hypothetical protein
MANTSQSGTVYIDTNDAQVFSGRCKVAYILHTSDNANDAIVLRDGTTSGAPIKISLKNPTADGTMAIDLSGSPILFQTGIYVSTLTSGSVCTLVLDGGGGNN